ncbi:UPAR/Ly6 domain-containing protein CG9338-like [Haematobia irritans]|uniref:UPAR/Ly6 domain-containing protein CG9338-like n=1 Tax=Haematobia irritans TaxID=7368 RepID=UPI003F4F76A1
MSSQKLTTICIVLATFLIDIAFAVQCYQCESQQNSKCGLNFVPDDSMKIECTSAPRYLKPYLEGHSKEATGCMKQTMESKLGGVHTVRSCYYGDLANTEIGCQIDPNNVLMKLETCHVCSGDWCNSSVAMTPALAIIAVVLCLARIIS